MDVFNIFKMFENCGYIIIEYMIYLRTTIMTLKKGLDI